MLEKIRIYAKITKLWAIARRYFVNNFYDGMLTVLGVLLGFFVLVLKGTETSIESNFILLAGLGSSISMFMSGITGSYLSERAEQKKLKEELNKAMGIGNQEIIEGEKGSEVKEIEKAMIMKIKHRVFMKSTEKLKPKKVKTLQENAERFASIVVSIINGGSPFLGGVIPLIPFLFVSEATISVFIISFFIILVCIILLGVFLGVVSKESIIKNIFQMSFAFLMTVVISLFLLG
ncbi:MAG: VIT1/CCC1 transporter family protein [Candidatus Thorarchaeota archaeon]